ncbi:MAG TPA: hypothetical protein VG122_08775 [Gemmata sp.]|jgi:hypothetical protein|nr:hypothetical protein [Gemmata sp.]
MRRLLVSIIICGLMVGLACASGTPTSVPPSSATIQTLVDQLGAEGFADREAASASLEKIGPPALEALRLAARSENQEIRDRAVIVLSKIQRTVDSVRLTAKRVKLSYKDMPIGTALNDLRVQTGLNIILDPNRIANPLRRITCETKELPIWEALEAFCVSAGLREVFAPELEIVKPQNSPRRGYVPPPPAPNADSIPVVLIDGKPDRLPGDRSTAVRVVALPPSFPGHKVTLGTGEVTLCLDVTPAPGIAWQEVTGVKISRVIDSAGRIGGSGTEKNPPSTFDPNGMLMFVRPGVAMRFDPMGNSIPPETLPNPRVLAVPLRVNTATAGSLKRLEGVVFAEVHALNQQLISVTDPKRNTNVAVTGPGELRFTVLEVKGAPPGKGGVGMIRVQLEYPSPWVTNARRRGGWNPGWPEPPRANTQERRVEAFDEAGKPFPVNSTSYNDMSDDGLVNIQMMTFTFRPDIGLPAKLVVVGPKPVIVQIPFAMENVPLP